MSRNPILLLRLLQVSLNVLKDPARAVRELLNV
jgi:hypothetical protein